MKFDDLSEDLRAKLLRPESAADIRNALPLLDELAAHSDDADSAAEHLWRAFSDLRRMSSGSPDSASEILLSELLPRCLTADDEQKARTDRLRSIFGNWLTDLPEEQRAGTRSEALQQARAALLGASAHNALSLISTVGYWDEAILNALDGLVRSRDGDIGDHALATRVNLRTIDDPRLQGEFLGRLQDRIVLGPSWHRMIACHIIGTAETAELIWGNWLAAGAADEFKREASNYFAWTILTEIARRLGSPEFTDRVWNWLIDLSQRPSGEGWMVFSANSTVINSLDTPSAIPELVRMINRTDDNRRLLYYYRILECKRPVNVNGWGSVAIGDLRSIRDAAVASTGRPGLYSSTELETKSKALELLLCRGQPAILPSLDVVLAGEDAYVAHRFLELGACLGLDPLPKLVEGLISGTAYDECTEDQRLMVQSAAIELARGAATRDAFEALLKYRQFGRHGMLLSVVEAIAEVAVVLMDSGDEFALEQLLSKAEEATRAETRKAAAAAVGCLIEMGKLPRDAVSRAADLLKLPTADAFSKRIILFALASRQPETVPSVAVEFARRVLGSQPAETEEIGTRELRKSAVALIAFQAGSSSDPAFLESQLGLQASERESTVDVQTLSRVPGYVLGRYFHVDSVRFAPAVASLLREGDEIQLAPLIPWIQKVGRDIPATVVDAMVARLKRADHGEFYDPTLLRTLAALAPDRLLRDACADMSRWLPQARADLADALGDLNDPPESLSDARFDLLVRLAGDGVYAVRRAAYRAAAKCEPRRFLQLALSWSQWNETGFQGPRLYAAESAGWFLDAVGANPLEELAHDPEPSVREAYQRSTAERSDRISAAAFEAEVLSVRDPAGVVRNWRHGVALSQVGDDSVLQRLDRRIRDGQPPSVRFWLKRIYKSVERRWGDVTRNWPEPWHTRQGRLERFEGVLHNEHGEAEMSGILWLMPADTPTGRHSWGGWGIGGNRPTIGGRLTIEGREPANLIITSSTLSGGEWRFLFLGSGQYPGLRRD